MTDDELNRPPKSPRPTSLTGTGEAEATKWKALAWRHEKAAKDSADTHDCGWPSATA